MDQLKQFDLMMDEIKNENNEIASQSLITSGIRSQSVNTIRSNPTIDDSMNASHSSSASSSNLEVSEKSSLTVSARVIGSKIIGEDDIPIIVSTPPGTLEIAFSEIASQRKYIEDKKVKQDNINIMVYDVEFNTPYLGMIIAKCKVNPKNIYITGFSSADAPSLKVNAIKIGDDIVSIQSGSKWITIDGDLDKTTRFINGMPRPIIIRFIRLNEANHNLPTLQEILDDEEGKSVHFLQYLERHRNKSNSILGRYVSGSSNDEQSNNSQYVNENFINSPSFKQHGLKRINTKETGSSKNITISRGKVNLKSPSSSASASQKAKMHIERSSTPPSTDDDSDEDLNTAKMDTEKWFQDSEESYALFIVETNVFIHHVLEKKERRIKQGLTRLVNKYMKDDSPLRIKFNQSVRDAVDQIVLFCVETQIYQSNADQTNEENANANNVDIDEAEVGKITSMIEVLRSDALSFLENSYRRFLHSSQALSMFNKFDIKYVKNPLFINITVDIILTSRPLCNIFLFYLLQNESHRPLVCWMYLNYSLITAVENVKLLIDNSISNINSSASLFEVSKYEDDNDGKILVDRVNNMKQKLFVLATKYFENDHQHQVISSNIRSSLQLLIARIDSIPVDKVSPEFLNEIKDIILNVTKEIVKINEACRNILKENFQDFKEDFNSMYTTVANIVRKIDNHEIPRISTILQESKLPDYITIHRLPSSEYSPSLFSLKSLSNKQQNILKYALIYRTDEASMTLTSELISSNVEEGTQMLNLNTKSITNFFVPEGIHAFGAVADSPSQGPYPPNPYIFNFVIGNGGGPKGNSKLYGTSLVSYEKASQGVLFLPIGVCLLSDFPVFQTMRRWIETNLFDKEVKHPNVSTEAVKTIANYSSSHRISSFVSTDSLNIASQKDELEPLDFQLLLLFRALKAENVISLFAQCLLERKILLVSKSYSVLLAVGESLRALLHPFAWSHVYAPVLPRANLDLLQCPTPFIIGIHQSYAFKKDFPFATDLVVVDLDNDSITVPQFATVGSTPALVSSDLHFPTKIAIDMKQRLHIALNPSLFFADQIDAADYCTDAIIVRNVRNIFDDAMKELTKNLSKCCINCEHPTENLVLLHELQLLNLYTDQEERMFMQQLIKTQSFSDFICSINNL